MPDPQSIPDLPPLPSPERLQALLHDAARIGRDDVIPALLQAGASIEGRDAKGYPPLILASYNGHATTTALLLAHGADPGGMDAARGNTALMGVAFKGHGEIVRLLVEAGSDVNQRNHAGQTALMNAAMFGHGAIVEMLLAAGADPGAIDMAGNSPASLASAQGNAEMVDRLKRSDRVCGEAAAGAVGPE